MKNLCILTVLFLPCITPQCPKTVDISPCKCTEISGHRRLSCWGDISLPRLTIILRDMMCGKSLEKFELLGFNITYLPSNLFSRISVDEIVVYSGKIERFTLGSRSAFYGLESTLNSLSMRRCHLADDLQWHLLGEMYALSYLDLAYNELTRIPAQWAKHPLPNVRSLILKGNDISTLHSGALGFMYTLVELDLSENKITSFSRAFLPRFASSLIILRLSYNNLETFPEDSFNEMFGLRRIYLDNNNITTLEENTWSPLWGDLELLDLNDNELRCDDDMFWIKKLRAPERLYGECVTGNFTGIYVALHDL